MKKSKILVSLVAHITASGLEDLSYGHIDLSDPRLDQTLGTVQIEYHASRRVAEKLIREVQEVRQRYGQKAALEHLDTYVISWRIQIVQMTTGDAVADEFVQRFGEARYGQTIPMATA